MFEEKLKQSVVRLELPAVSEFSCKMEDLIKDENAPISGMDVCFVTDVLLLIDLAYEQGRLDAFKRAKELMA